jgi:choline dehydrogenase
MMQPTMKGTRTAMKNDQTFDYVVIGAGAAGCVVANRLSADPSVTVLLLEAGGSDKDFATARLDLPALFSLWGPDTSWGYNAESDPGLNGRRMHITQGKVLGGGSSINGRIYLRGNRRDYDHWNFLGNEGWSYAELLPYFKKFEDYSGGASEYHGAGGPVSVIDLPAPSPVSEAFMASAAEVLGYQGPPWDFNGPQQEGGVGCCQSTTTRDFARASTSVAYIHPIMERPNFTLQLRAPVTRILFEGDRAVGVEYIQDGALQQARATTEVILSAGAFGSPKTLMLSGIGPAEQLRAHGIPVIADLPGVGQNLQDHLLVRLSYVCKQKQPDPILLAEACLFTYTRAGIESASPDLQFLFGPFLFPDIAHSGPGFTVVPIIAQPTSVGNVTLGSNDPLAPLIINANYLSTESDIQVLLRGLRLGRELVHTSFFERLRGEELTPGDDFQDERMLREYIRNTCITVWHPCGTCKMGHDRQSVVDPQLRVHGVSGLRVIDSSIMPRIVNANLQATCIMIGEKGADMLQTGRVA